MPDPKFEIVITTAGQVSIRDNDTREIMHNPVGPWVEANALYVEQSRLVERLSQPGDELVIFDVGLGAAANALAVLHARRRTRGTRPIRLVSFERDLSLLRFALDHSAQFAHFAGYETAVESILAGGPWREDGLTWELRHGNFASTIEVEPRMADLIFHEPYSPVKNPDMWTTALFAKLLAKCQASGALLLTYSQATPVRVALLRAGYFVGIGVAIGRKHETTQASTRLKDLEKPLGTAWFERWQKSHAPNAIGAAESELDDVRAFVRAHPQFHEVHP